MPAATADLEADLAALSALSTNELCARYEELTGQPVRTRHKAYLLRKVAWRLQAAAEGDLTARARRRAAELADDADVRVMPPRPPRDPAAGRAAGTAGTAGRTVVVPAPTPAATDPRLPAPGTALTRRYKGRVVSVTVRPDGFEHDGQRYRTLTAAAAAITGSHLNGYRFFGLTAKTGGAK